MKRARSKQLLTAGGKQQAHRRPRWLLFCCLPLALLLALPVFIFSSSHWNPQDTTSGLWDIQRVWSASGVPLSWAALRSHIQGWGFRFEGAEGAKGVPGAWVQSALAQSILSGRVVQAVHIEEQLLLLLTLPCSVAHLLTLLRLSSSSPSSSPSSPLSLFTHHSGSPKDPLRLLLPWSCALAPNISTQQHTTHSSARQLLPLQGISARANLVHIRCALPQNEPPPGTPVTVSLKKLSPLEGGKGTQGTVQNSASAESVYSTVSVERKWREALQDMATWEPQPRPLDPLAYPECSPELTAAGSQAQGQSEGKSTTTQWQSEEKATRRRLLVDASGSQYPGGGTEAGTDTPGATDGSSRTESQGGGITEGGEGAGEGAEAGKGEGEEGGSSHGKHSQDGGEDDVTHYVASDAVWAGSDDPAFSARRLVLESYPQGEGLYLFAQGVDWDRDGVQQKVGKLTCVYGYGYNTASSAGSAVVNRSPGASEGLSGGEDASWKAPAIIGVPGEQKAIGCPYPPPQVAAKLWPKAVRTLGTPGEGAPQGKSGEGAEAGAVAKGAEGESVPVADVKQQLVPVTLEDQQGVLPSVAFYDPSLPIPAKWRERDINLHCPADRRPGYPQAELKERKHFLCACTMGWNVAKFLKEWTTYHAFLGVDHFFLYDNNSDDDVYNLAVNLSRTVPHWSTWRFPGTRNASGSGDKRGSEGSKRRIERGMKSVGGNHWWGAEDWQFMGRVPNKTVGVTVYPWPWLKTQQAGFAHCVLNAGPLCEWLMFTDVDEFVYPKYIAEYKTRSEVLIQRDKKGPFLSFALQWAQRSDCPTVVGQWGMQSLVVGPSGQASHPKEGVTMGYTCRTLQHGDNKVILRPQATRKELTHWIHIWGLAGGYQQSRRSTDLTILYHYKFQAWDEYKTKFHRRVAGGVGDWKKVYRPGQTMRSDGVRIEDGVAHPPPNWASRYCDITDRALARLVRFALARYQRNKEVMPWQA